MKQQKKRTKKREEGHCPSSLKSEHFSSPEGTIVNNHGTTTPVPDFSVIVTAVSL
ncbi:hypothetical protein LFML04_2056 [Leptospirillum ferriphilum ML-04]|jgi:hypothetical protein|nr:hypothetical protein LFML04_2056 [Leptospirillum ferriphilum ML-04]